MSEYRPVLERARREFPAPEMQLDAIVRRRRRREVKRRVGTAALALAISGAAIGSLLQVVNRADPRPADQFIRPFVGEWAATDYHDYFDDDMPPHQTMTIRAGEDGVVHVAVHQTSSSACSQTPTTMTGTARLEDPTTLVVRSPRLTCDEGDPDLSAMQISAMQEEGRSYTLVLDLVTDRLYDNLGVVWNRGAPPRRTGTATQAGVDGPGSFALLHGEVTFRAAEPWGDHFEAYLDPRTFFLVTGSEDREAWIEILVNPLPRETPCDSLRVPTSAEELVQAIRSNPDLEATAPVTERVGGIDALRMDVAAAPGASIPCGGDRIPVVHVPDRGGWGTVERGGLGRLYVLDVPGGSARTLAILISGPDAAVFDQAIETAAPVLESFEFIGE